MRLRWRTLVGAGLFGLVGATSASAQGLMMPNGGAIGGNMAGTTSTVACDAVGALFWNPAAIGGWPGTEVTIGSNLLFPRTGVTSTLQGGGQRAPQSGRTASDSGLVPTTGLGIIHRPDDSQFTYGLGMNTIAAGGVNFPGDPNNPILAPTGPGGQFILGPQAASLSVLSITPTVAYQLTDSFAIGMGPVVDVAAVSFDPAFFGPPSAPNFGGPQQFPTGSHSRPFWGGGFRVGTTHRVTDHVTTGLSYSSPHWFENWEFNARNANGTATQFSTGFSLPQIVSMGVAYDGIENLLLAADVRWMDYGTTKLLGDSIKDGGAGWRSIWATSVGSNYRITDALSVQAGYLYNQNPVPSNLALFNTMLPCITTNTVTCGTYYQFNSTIGMSLGYAHGFDNSVSGSVLQLNRLTTKLDTKYDAIVLGLTIKFGSGGQCCAPVYGDGETFETGETSSITPTPSEATPNAADSSVPLPMPKDAPNMPSSTEPPTE